MPLEKSSIREFYGSIQGRLINEVIFYWDIYGGHRAKGTESPLNLFLIPLEEPKESEIEKPYFFDEDTNNIPELLYKEKIKTRKDKPFIVANVRDILERYPEEISFSRMVELFNEIAFNYYNKIKPI